MQITAALAFPLSGALPGSVHSRLDLTLILGGGSGPRRLSKRWIVLVQVAVALLHP